MSSFLSSFPKKFLNAVFVLVLLAAVLVSCDSNIADDTNDEGTLPEGLIATWSSIWGDGYRIGKTDFQYTSDYGDAYAGTIEFVSNYSNNSGVIIIKYSTPPANLIYGTEQPFYNGNDYTAVYYRNLTNAEVDLARAINLIDFSSVDTATLNEAKSKFTRGKMGDYVGAWGSYNR